MGNTHYLDLLHDVNNLVADKLQAPCWAFYLINDFSVPFSSHTVPAEDVPTSAG